MPCRCANGKGRERPTNWHSSISGSLGVLCQPPLELRNSAGLFILKLGWSRSIRVCKAGGEALANLIMPLKKYRFWIDGKLLALSGSRVPMTRVAPVFQAEWVKQPLPWLRPRHRGEIPPGASRGAGCVAFSFLLLPPPLCCRGGRQRRVIALSRQTVDPSRGVHFKRAVWSLDSGVRAGKLL